MADDALRIPRPTPTTAYRILARNRQVAADWAALLRTRLTACIQCWDHLANSPTQPVGSRYVPLKGAAGLVRVPRPAPASVAVGDRSACPHQGSDRAVLCSPD